jgi:hypothetical protein
MTIPPAANIARLPDPARRKLFLLDGLMADALDAARSAQNRLNEVGRRNGADDPNIERLSAIVRRESHRQSELADVTNRCVAWLRTLPETMAVEMAGIEPPKLAEGETVEDTVLKLRARIGAATVEQHRVSLMPEPKADLKRQMRAHMAELVRHAAPTLRLERGKAQPVFADQRRDFGLSETYLVGLMGWLIPEAMEKRLDGMIDALPNFEALSSGEQAKRIAALTVELDGLERAEEALIELAASQGQDILRRGVADVDAVLGVREIEAKPLQAPVAAAAE